MENQKSKIKNQNFGSYQSPLSWRYGSDEMRKIFSEENKYRLWRRIWVVLAEAQAKEGLVSQIELVDLKKHQEEIDIDRILEIEKVVKHDVVAAIKEFAEKAKIGGGKIHLGATSMDISDNAETLRIVEVLKIIEEELRGLLKAFGEKIEKYADVPCMGYTHLQPAEPTTLGYRLAFYAQDLLLDLEFLQFVKKNLKGKGIKGAVGTSASFVKLLDEKRAQNMESEVMDELNIEPAEITNQTAPRKIEFWVASLLSSIAQSLNKFAFDLRIMQSAGFGEWQEPFAKTQVGSSAMPFKKNPIKAEQICSLARLVISLARVTWDNASLTLLERTLDDSANRRIVTPEMFLAVDEMLNSATNIVQGFIVNEKRVAKNLANYWDFAATEGILVEAVKNGADRQKMHEILREISMKAWEKVQDGEETPVESLLLGSKELGKYLKPQEIKKLLDAEKHIGNASQKAYDLAEQIKKIS